MRVSNAEARRHREDILDAAGRLFRARGFDGVGIAELMAAAGLTNGAFYGHFASKETLMAEACHHIIRAQTVPWTALAGGGKADLTGFVHDYLGRWHVDTPQEGCLFVSLGGEAHRKSAPVRAAIADGLRRRLDQLASALAPRRRARERSMAALATLVGAVVLARAADDRGLADEILAAAARQVLEET